MSNKIKVDLGNNSYNISLIEDFKASVVKFASSTESQCMLSLIHISEPTRPY